MTATWAEIEHDLNALLIPPRPREELSRLELQYLHNQAVVISAQWREFFPDVVRPSSCPFDAKPAPGGTLAAFMRANTP